VNERLGESETALKYFHRALESNPPDAMRPEIVKHMQQILQKTGQKAPPLDQGAMPPGSTPSGTPPGTMPPGGAGK
jgi:hypothetical protein